jgi:DNA-binding Lrp family transcriptional regulator
MWSVDPARVDDVGSAIANHRGVSRCYLRPSYDDWPYTIYATVHGRTIDECESLLLEVSRDHDLAKPKALFPLREYKRTRIALFPPEAAAWEDARLEPTARSAAS